VEDSFGATSNAATVSLTINPVNDAPVATADTATTTEDTPVSIDVAANDTDVDSGDAVDSSTIVVVTQASNGTATVNAGKVDYTPAANFNGSDSFSYTIQDQNGAVSNSANVVVNVTGVNDLPTAGNDSATTNEDTAVSIDVVANDSDVDGSVDSTTVQVMTNAAHGSTSVDAISGAITYTPSANFNGSDSFTYVVKDDSGGTSNTATVSITVSSVNDAPLAVDDTATLQEDMPLSVNVLGNDSDVDGTLMPATVEVVTAPADGSTSINAATGAITYTPSSNYNGTDSFTYRVQDNAGLWSSPATVTLTVQAVNDAPLANDDSSTLDQDTSATISVLSNDSDIDGSLDTSSVNIASAPSHGVAMADSNGSVSYTPDSGYTGSDSFTYTVFDNLQAESNAATVTVTVNALNVAPSIGGSAATSASVGTPYTFTPTASDADSGDTLSFSATGLPAWLGIDSASGTISGTPADADVGSTGNIVVSVSDGTATVSLAAFSISVAAGTDSDGDGFSDYQEGLDQTDPADPLSYLDLTPPTLIAPADISADASGLYTPVTLRQLLGLAASASDSDVDDALAALASDNIDGDGCCNPVVSTMSDNTVLLPPGSNALTWTATDRIGNSATVTQIVNLRPLVSMSKDQTVVEGSSAQFSIILNGKSPFYPLTVPYLIDTSSTATSSDYQLSDGSVTFTNGQTRVSVSVPITADNVMEGDETLVLRLDDRTSKAEDLANGYDPQNPDIYDINSGAKTQHVITISERNLPPDASLSLAQGGADTVLVTTDGGMVTASAQVSDPNPGDTASFDWSGSDNNLSDTDGNSSDATLVFDPSGLSPGRHELKVLVSDSMGASDTATLYFRVVASLPNLSNANDSDNDGLDDQSEGTGDSDGDGIPNYLDNIPESNVVPEQAGETGKFLMECDPGVRCGLGKFSLLGQNGGTQLDDSELSSQSDLSTDTSFDPVGGIFDFTVNELPEPGQSVSIVIPQTAAIPANAVYRKFQNGAWVTFVEDADNQLHSAAGSAGFCPPPGDAEWQPGLVAGNFCVQLTIEDGGPNDADGEVNSSVDDPGAVSVAKRQPPTGVSHDIKSSGKGGGSSDTLLLGLLAALALTLKRWQSRSKKAGSLNKAAGLLLPALMISGLMCSSHEVQAQGWRDNTHAELALYQAKSPSSEADFVRGLSAQGVSASVSNYDTSRMAWQLSAGYRVNDWATVQLGYLDLGKVDVNFSASAADDTTIETALEKHYPFTASGFTLAYRYRHKLSEMLSFTGDAGIFRWKQKIDVNIASLRPHGDSGSDPLLALGLDYAIGNNVYAGLRVERLFIGNGDMNLFGIAASWNFQ